MGDIKDLLRKTLADAGVDLKEQLNELVAYTEERVDHLRTMVGTPDFQEAVVVERDNIVLKTANLASARADDFDKMFVGVIHGAITILAG